MQELVRKKRYGRLQKALADVSLLAGSAADAHEHYTTAEQYVAIAIVTWLLCVQELVRKKRYGRLQKALADVSLLAGSAADAHDHYTTAAELSRALSHI